MPTLTVQPKRLTIFAVTEPQTGRATIKLISKADNEREISHREAQELLANSGNKNLELCAVTGLDGTALVINESNNFAGIFHYDKKQIEPINLPEARAKYYAWINGLNEQFKM